MPFTTRPASTSRHGMMRLASMMFGEVLEQSQPCGLTLLGVKLDAADIAAGDDRRISDAVLGLSDDHLCVIRLAVEGVDEVEERPVADAFGERVPSLPPDLVPTDLRHAHACGEAAHAALQKPEPARRAELLRLLEEHLHPDADAEQ